MFLLLPESRNQAAQYVVPCSVRVLCLFHAVVVADGAELPFSDMQIPTFISFSAHATVASLARGHGSHGLCVELQFVFGWPISRLISLKPAVKSKIMCSRASSVANAAMSSAKATFGKYHSSNLKPDSFVFPAICCSMLQPLSPPVVWTPWCFWRPLRELPCCFVFS